MSTFSRRSFIGGLSAAVPFTLWAEKYKVFAQTRVRPNVMSPQGQAMLNIYASAVQTMMSTPESNPIGWLFQWYTHSVRDDRSKTQEINRLYPTASPRRTLAQQTWETCQAHKTTDIEAYFLPWHRMYLFYFERIIQRVSNNPNFALPYWDYTNTNARLPDRFINPGNTSNPLFRQNRRASVNAGLPIDGPGFLNLNSLRQCTYLPVGTAIPGFNMDLDNNLHGRVHVRVGNDTRGMGTIFWAAQDPIFWLHHCNIDRLWASWNAAGRRNPTTTTWLNKQFVFANENGVRVVGTNSNFRDIAPLGYSYEALAPVPTCPPGTGAAGPPQRRARVATALQLSTTPAKARLLPPPGAGAGVGNLAARVRALTGNRRLYLVISKLSATAQPGTTFDVFLELPADASGAAAEAYKIGTIHFFDAVGHGAHGPAATTTQQKFFSFDITDVAKRLVEENRLTATPELTIAPADEVNAQSRPVVGEINLIEQ